MILGSKEHFEIMADFEKNFKHLRLDREKDKELNKKGILYQSGETNNLFKAFILGYSFGKFTYSQ